MWCWQILIRRNERLALPLQDRQQQQQQQRQLQQQEDEHHRWHRGQLEWKRLFKKITPFRNNRDETRTILKRKKLIQEQKTLTDNSKKQFA